MTSLVVGRWLVGRWLVRRWSLVVGWLVGWSLVGWSLVVGWLVGWLVGCHARALWPNGAS